MMVRVARRRAAVDRWRAASRAEEDAMQQDHVAAAAEGFAFHRDLTALVGDIPEESIVSRQVVNDELVKVTLFGFAAGQELSEHTASKSAILQVVSGEGTFGLGAEVMEVGPGSWVHMAPHLPHTVTARTTLVLLLVMLKGARSD